MKKNLILTQRESHKRMSEHVSRSQEESRHPIFDQPAVVEEVELERNETGRRFSIEWAVGVGADVVLDDNGEYYIDYIEVAPHLSGQGIATELYRRLETHARRLNAKFIAAEMPEPASEAAVRRAYGDKYVTQEARDEASRAADHSDYSGYDHDLAVLHYPLDENSGSNHDEIRLDDAARHHNPNWTPPSDAFMEAEKARQDIEDLMDGGVVSDAELRHAERLSAVTRDLNDLEHAQKSKR